MKYEMLRKSCGIAGLLIAGGALLLACSYAVLQDKTTGKKFCFANILNDALAIWA